MRLFDTPSSVPSSFDLPVAVAAAAAGYSKRVSGDDAEDDKPRGFQVEIKGSAFFAPSPSLHMCSH